MVLTQLRCCARDASIAAGVLQGLGGRQWFRFGRWMQQGPEAGVCPFGMTAHDSAPRTDSDIEHRLHHAALIVVRGHSTALHLALLRVSAAQAVM
jgi:hypothetical protein